MRDWDLDRLAPRFDPTAPPRVLTRDEALRRGYTRGAIEHRLVTGRWHRILPRTYLTVDTLTFDDRCRAALAFAGQGAVLSGAAALTDLELRAVRRPDRLLVLVPSTTRLVPTGFARIRPTRRLPEPDLRPGPACAPVARAVADLALETRRLDDVRALVTEVVRRRLCAPDELAAEMDAGPRNGSAHLRDAVEEVLDGAWSAPEGLTGRLLRAARVPAFEQNARIDLPGGRWLVVDFLWRELRAVLEIDSDAHHGLPGDARRTLGRHLQLEALGYSTVHYPPRFITAQPREFTAQVTAWLAGLARVRSA